MRIAARGRPLGIGLSAVLLGLAGFAVFDLVRESEVAASRRALETQALALARGDTPDVAMPATPLAGEPRALVDDALLLARTAAGLPPGPRRDALLAHARRGIDRAVATRPGWAAAIVVATYVHGLAGSDIGRAREALAASYAAAPFLHDGGMYRIGFGLDHWADLPEPTRNSIVDEALWTIIVSPAAAPAIGDRIRRSPAYLPFMLRWHALDLASARR
jgi:hypothetical protein